MFKKNSFNLAVVLVFVLGLFAPGTNQIAQAQENQVENAQSNESEVPTNRIIIKYKEGTNASFMPTLEPQMQRVREASNWSLEYVREMSDQAHVLELPQRVSAEQMEAIVAQLESLPEVEYAEPDRIYHPTVAPNDSLYGDQWYLHDTWGINAPAAWEIETGSTNVVIAVLDTGIAPHGDIMDRLVAGYDFISQDFWNSAWVNYTANDGNGRDNDPSDPGDWITVNENNGSDKDEFFLNCGASNSSWHGTHVAGIIGAKTNNNEGIAGVDWNARILPVRVLGKCGGYTSDIIDGMRWAAGLTVTGVPANANPAHIINLSLGGPGSCSITEQNAVTEILNAGTVIVAAAGNSNANVNNFSPANCTGVIAVAATNNTGEKATYSNFGSGIDISAPGDDIFSLIDIGPTIPDEEGYDYKSGTSMAAPQVSGVLGLMFAINPDLTPAQALLILQRSAKAFPDGGTCTTTNCGAGILDAGAAVALTELPDLIITNVTLNPVKPVSGQPFEVNVTVKNQGGSTTSGIVYPADIWVDVDPRTLPQDENGCPDSDSDYFRPNDNYSYAPGDSRTLSVNIDNPPLTGGHQLWVYVDATCLAEEGMEDNNVMGPIAVGRANIDVTIGGTLQGTYPLANETSEVVGYVVDGGPVVIESTNGVNIIASLSQQRRRPNTTAWTGGTQIMAVPLELITNQYVLPRYDYTSPSTKLNQILIANVDTVPRAITITIGGVERGIYNLDPAESQYIRYSGLAGGPVVVSSDTGAKIVASLYELVRDPALPGWSGQSEMMGLPFSQVSDEYLIPQYFGASSPNTLIPSLFIANVDSIPTTVEVIIGGVSQGTFNLPINSVRVVNYIVDGGPVVVKSNNNANLAVSLSQQRRRPNTTAWTGVAQSMALPVELITNEYIIPRYDYTSPSTRLNQILIANVDTVARDITITIGGTVMGVYNLDPAESQYIRYSGVGDGPVVVSSVTGAKIVASLYELFRDPALPGWNDQSEMMGLPWSQLSDQYLIPQYFGASSPNTLIPSLFIAVP